MGCQQSAPKVNRKASSHASDPSTVSTSSGSSSKAGRPTDPRSAALSMRSGGFFGPSYCGSSGHMRDSGMYALGFGVAY